jgi:hypothetical protein
MTQRLLMFALFALAALSCDPANPVGLGTDGRYLPLAAGNYWNYEVITRVRTGVEPVQSVMVALDSPFTYDGVAWYGANNYCRQRTISSPLPMYCAAWGIRGRQTLFAQQGPGPARFEPETILDLPVWFGKSWFTKRPIDTSYVTVAGDTVVLQEIRRRTAKGVSAVRVPAGTFERCLLVADTSSSRSRIGRADGTEVADYFRTLTSEWYAEDVGLVKQVVERYREDETTPWLTETRILRVYSVENR